MPEDWCGYGIGLLKRINYAANYLWRLFATDLSFSLFGVGALVIGATAFPLIHLVAFVFSLGPDWAHRRCQFLIHLAFKFFATFMSVIRVVTHEIEGAEKLKGLKGTLVVANHPTLLDVVFIISMMPQTQCVVKKAAWSNPFLMGVMWGVGYIQNDEPLKLIEDCVGALETGSNLVIFPEATRTVKGQRMKLKRGAASIISGRPVPFIPITITCRPPTLSKEDTWYLPPPHRAHFKIIVHDAYDPGPELVDITQLSLSNRYINRVLFALFSSGIELHDRSD